MINVFIPRNCFCFPFLYIFFVIMIALLLLMSKLANTIMFEKCAVFKKTQTTVYPFGGLEEAVVLHIFLVIFFCFKFTQFIIISIRVHLIIHNNICYFKFDLVIHVNFSPWVSYYVHANLQKIKAREPFGSLCQLTSKTYIYKKKQHFCSL